MAKKLPQVTSVGAFSLGILGQTRIFVFATGTAPTSGWSGVRLSPRYYVAPPADGIWDFDLLADEPLGIVLEVITPHAASGVFAAPEWVKVVRIHGGQNSMDAKVVPDRPLKDSQPEPARLAKTGNVIVQREIAVYDDSFNPIGMCSPWSVRMKKLRHTLTLTVEGPDEARNRHCIEQAAAAGALAAIVAAFITGGAALSAAISAFLTMLKGCLGESFSARIDDNSYWIEWCT
jgi:hypothetical protein